MMKELVIDTNVIVHAHNEANLYHESALACLTSVLQSKINICVDDDFQFINNNSSVIISEYIQHVRSGTYGYYFLLQMASNGRITVYQKKNYNKEKALLRKIIPNKHDIIFLIITLASHDKYFISNDYNDFNTTIRNEIKRKYDTTIDSSKEFDI